MKKKAVKTIFIFFALICCNLGLGKNLLAQQNDGTASGEIKGTVHFKSNAIAYASVLLKEAKDSSLVKGSITDSLGNYIFRNIQSGNYFVTVYYTGYEKYSTSPISVKSTTDHYTVPDISLQAAAVQSLENVTVKAKKQVIERKSGKLIFNVENSIGAAGSTAWDVLRQAPNVKTDGQGNVSLRGNRSAAVMIDNKLVQLSGEDLINLLVSIRAENISKIELINNPSSRYDAEGRGGLINILTKRNKEEGWNGTATVGYEQNTYAKYNGGLNLNYKKKALSIAGNYGYKNGEYLTKEYLDQEFSEGNLSTYFNEQLDRKRQQTNNNYKLDASYAINEKNTIGIIVDGYHSGRSNNDISRTPIRTNFGKTDSAYLSRIYIDGNSNYFSLNTNYRGVFDSLGRSLNIDIDYLKYNSGIFSINENHFLQADGQDMRPAMVFRSRTPQAIQIYTAKLDYNHPLNAQTSFQTGVKINRTETDNDYVFENLENDKYINDPSRSNQFNYQEDIMAIYGNFTKEFNKFTLEAGLRGEYTRTKGNSVTANNLVNRSYFKLFPAIYLQRKINDNYQLEFNYGMRIQRPSYAYMNPFRYYSTPFSYSEGNPFLQPAYTNSFEFTQTYKDKYSLTLYYTTTKGEFVQLPEQNIGTKTIAFHRLNLDKSQSYGLSVGLPFELNKWQSYNSIDVSYDQVSSGYLGSTFSNKKLTANFSTVQSFALSKKWSAEIRGNYRFPGISGLFQLGSYSEVALGVKRKLLKDRGTISINFSDIFKGTVMPARVNYLNQKSIARTDNDLRGIRINFSYKFGKSGVKPIKEHGTGNKEERKRIGR